MLPTEYGLTATNPEAYVAIAVDDLLHKKSRESLHLDGEPTAEYLGMLALYAIKQNTHTFPENEPYGKLINYSCDAFEPSKMSSDLIRCLKDLIKEVQE